MEEDSEESWGTTNAFFLIWVLAMIDDKKLIY